MTTIVISMLKIIYFFCLTCLIELVPNPDFSQYKFASGIKPPTVEVVLILGWPLFVRQSALVPVF